MEIKIGKRVILIGVLLFVGYIAIFISVISQPSYSNFRPPEVNSRLLSLQKELTLKENEINRLSYEIRRNELRDQMAKKGEAEETETTPPFRSDLTNAPIIAPVRTAVRPGVIILGMHRSGIHYNSFTL